MNNTAQRTYRVLARKYRPKTFSELIGQDALVRTLSNALTLGRLAHAFVLTGVRGIGKTSTARLLAKGLNCIGVDGSGGPTLEPCGRCEPCQAIASGRHVDILEMDAASHTGVDDAREIIEGVGYKAQLKGQEIVLSLGFSHDVVYQIPEGITVDVQGGTNVSVEGIDKQLVGQVAASIRDYSPVEPYKGKGVRYAGEHVRRKEGKAVA